MRNGTSSISGTPISTACSPRFGACEIRRVRLATYRYKGEPALGTSHLGFIIDDLGASPAVGSDGTHVDLYGYASMAVAAIQIQQRRIEALEREVAALRNERTPRR